MKNVRGFFEGVLPYARLSLNVLKSLARSSNLSGDGFVLTTPAGEIPVPPLTIVDFAYSNFMGSMVEVEYPLAYLNYDGHEIVFDISLPYSVVVLYETFKRESYNLPIEGRVVVDVGAFIGDSSIFYYMNGAEKVFSIEPHPKNFSVLRKNLKMNRIPKSRIRPLNAGISERPLTLPVRSRGGRTAWYKEGITIDNLSLDEILDGHENVILKMDCEGCEFHALSNSSLPGVSDVVMEYHSRIGNIDRLVSMMREKGFSIKHEKSTLLERFFGIGLLHFSRNP